ncbi:phage GP46 family protein [Pantoea stewartii]|uniref:GP46 family protein n=1 Tax=Pantoea stewartii subsp. stewartii DC283 TaxID=660596 RepID=H3RLN7_PANSE|nr:phage GP46 family protein [Pantoea stewartii]ARF52792.1 hypothetical protein DSJ_26665 [Pantoea stewartii subsp. stewartii DC283]EHT97750.1 GP46 family protein [Pantoea stewartii subsp. stewartii DC283]KAB0553975.1 hypothetical protein F7Q90_12335 [Pantoea stewartii subsp. stewartii]
MTDIKTIWYPESGGGDWQEAVGDLDSGSDVDTAVYISLFSDRQARSDDSIDGDDRKGWWGDLDADYQIGSRIWLLRRQRLTTTVANSAASYAKEALQWLIDDGVLDSVSVSTQIVYPRSLFMTITCQKPDGTSTSAKYGWVWET